MSKFVLYAHGGSGNHGCEAIVRSTVAMLAPLGKRIILLSSNPDEDKAYGIDQICEVEADQHPYSKKSLSFAKAYLTLKLRKDYIPMDKMPYRQAFSMMEQGDIALSIGGDNYCYADVEKYTMLHDVALARGAKTVLWGCSVEPDVVARPEVAKDLARYSLITARESISYEALKKVNANTVLVSDPAFTLAMDDHVQRFSSEEGIIGINVSPMVMNNEKQSGIVMANYIRLIDYLINETKMSIVLIPHVVWKNGDDRIPLKKIFDQYRETKRVFMVDDQNCEQLKGVIAQCRFFVGARTHATIAAYSSGVPTLVVGYSVKARGIARDIFGTEKGHIISAQKMHEENELLITFENMLINEKNTRAELMSIMKKYHTRALIGKQEIQKLL